MNLRQTALLIIVVGSFAGAEARAEKVGNGGNSVVCTGPDGGIRSIEMFDYWEMDQAHPFPGGIRLGAPDLSVDQKIDLALSRLDRLDPVRAADYRSQAHEIADSIDQYLADGVSGTPIDDGHDQATPSLPCRKTQFAIQYSVPRPDKRRFQIDRTLYNSPAATNDARAGIILHEVIYREAIARGAMDSDRVRVFNYTLATNRLETMTAPEYEQFLKLSGFEFRDTCHPVIAPNLGSLAISVDVSTRIKEGDLYRYKLCGSAQYDLIRGNLKVEENSFAFFDADFSVRMFENVSWNYTGDRPFGSYGKVWVSTGGSFDGAWGGLNGNVKIEANGDLLTCDRYFQLNTAGKVVNCGIPFGQKTYVKLQDRVARLIPIATNEGEDIAIYDNGMLRHGVITSFIFHPHVTVPLKAADAHHRKFRFKGLVEFDSEGFVTDGPIKPVSKKVGNYTVTAGDLHVSADGRAYSRVSTFIPAIIQELPILAPASVSAGVAAALTARCKDEGFVELADEYGGMRSSTVDVHGYTNFYDLETGKTVAKFDEKVEVLDKIKCNGTVDL